MADPEFLHSVLSSLPNVDPDSEAVKAAIGQATQQNSSKSGNDIVFYHMNYKITFSAGKLLTTVLTMPLPYFFIPCMRKFFSVRITKFRLNF